MSGNIQVKQLKPVYPAEEHENVRALLDYAAETYGDDAAFILKEKSAGRKAEPVYRNITYKELREDVRRLGTGMMKEGISHARIAIIGENSYHWQLAYLTAMSGLGICVPLDKGLPYTELKTSIQKSGCNVLIFDRKHASLAEQLRKEAADPISTPTAVSVYICMDDDEKYMCFSELLDKGGEAIASGSTAFDSLTVNREALSNLIFTSGTTSAAKAVMLNQRNIMFNVYSLKQVEDIRHGDVNIALLPFHHTFGATGQLLMYSCGVTTVFCDGLKYLQKNFVEYHVSVFIGVPLLMEAMYKKIMAGIRKKGKEKTFERGVRISRMLRKVRIDVRRKLFKEVLDELGGSLRMVVSGAAALDSAVIRGYEDIGVEVVQGYGMTECAPMITFSRPDDLIPGCAGKALPTCQVCIKDGEICAKGDNVMQGYYVMEKETAETIDKDGWIHTGDLGYLDEKGHLFITGRKKELIVLSNGKNINPSELEQMMEADEQRVKEVAVVEDEGVLKAIIRPQVLWAAGKSVQELETALKREVVDVFNQNVSSYKQIHGVFVYDGELPRTRLDKLQRFKLGDIVAACKSGMTSGGKDEESEPTTEEYSRICQYIQREKKVTKLSFDFRHWL